MNSVATSSENDAQRDQSHARQRTDIRRIRHGEIADDADHRGVQQRTREQGRDRRRAFAMCVGQPGVHRCQTDLGAVADQHEQERQY